MRISSADERDVGALATLMTASPLLHRYRVTARGARAALGEGLRKGDMLLIAREKGEITGLAWVIVSRALDRSAYLRLLLVAEGKQSSGTGAALLATAERRARASRCRHMVLLVTSDNWRARSFYARQGYRRVGDLPSFVRPRIGETLYEKSLS